MTIQEYILIFITSLGGTSSILLITAFLGKSLLSNLFNRELEKFKAQLSIQVHEKNTKISRLDKDKANAVKNLHFSIANLENHAVMVFMPFINITPKLEVILQSQCDMGNEFLAFHKSVVHFQYELELYSIYFDNSLVQEIHTAVVELKQNTHETVLKVSKYIENEINPINENERRLEYLWNIKNTFEEDFNKTFYPLRIKLISIFRKLLSY